MGLPEFAGQARQREERLTEGSETDIRKFQKWKRKQSSYQAAREAFEYTAFLCCGRLNVFGNKLLAVNYESPLIISSGIITERSAKRFFI